MIFDDDNAIGGKESPFEICSEEDRVKERRQLEQVNSNELDNSIRLKKQSAAGNAVIQLTILPQR